MAIKIEAKLREKAIAKIESTFDIDFRNDFYSFINGTKKDLGKDILAWYRGYFRTSKVSVDFSEKALIQQGWSKFEAKEIEKAYLETKNTIIQRIY